MTHLGIGQTWLLHVYTTCYSDKCHVPIPVWVADLVPRSQALIAALYEMVSSLTDNEIATFHEHCNSPTWLKGKGHLQYSASLHQRCNDNLTESAPLRRSDNSIWKNKPFYFVLDAFPTQKSRLHQGSSKHETSINELYQL